MSKLSLIILSVLFLIFTLLFPKQARAVCAAGENCCEVLISGGVNNQCTAPLIPNVDSATLVCTCVQPDQQTCSTIDTLCKDDNTCKPADFPSCANYICIGANQAHLGKCQTPDNICSKQDQGCSNDTECKNSGDSRCSTLTCWTMSDRTKKCQYGSSPKAVGEAGGKAVGVGTANKTCTDSPASAASPGVITAIGCVPTDPIGFIKAASQLVTGAGGGIALLLMISGVFRMMTSAGNPDGVKAGSEQFTSALIGLLFIIFAVLLLRVIGVSILNIPGFGPI